MSDSFSSFFFTAGKISTPPLDGGGVRGDVLGSVQFPSLFFSDAR